MMYINNVDARLLFGIIYDLSYLIIELYFKFRWPLKHFSIKLYKKKEKIYLKN